MKITENAKHAAKPGSPATRQHLPPGTQNRLKFASLLDAFGNKNQSKTAEVKDLTPLTLDDYRNLALPVRQRKLTARSAVARRESASREQVEAPEKLQKVIEASARKFKLPVQLVTAVIKVESNFNPRAVSSEGARGLMQLMPATAASLGVKNVFDVSQNINGGCRYLKDMLEQFDGNLELALAAYNAGPGAVEKYGRIPPYRETQDYVKKVLAYC